VLAPALELLVAELDSLGSLGMEERADATGAVLLLAYFPAGSVDAGVLTAAAARCGARWLGCEPVPPADWDRSWREGLGARCIGGLWIRPSWCASQGLPELVLDPRQAFGTGEHATTRLALRLLLEQLRPGDRVLDVGTGSAILALAALRRGAVPAVGVDCDPLAAREAAENARLNALPLQVVCGTPDALDPAHGFEVVVANLLLAQLEPHAAQLGRLARRALILSGSLEAQRPRLDALYAATPWRPVRELTEEQSGDRWLARVLHARSRQS
jgi:ribosomal protein L11 methyltransferase